MARERSSEWSKIITTEHYKKRWDKRDFTILTLTLATKTQTNLTRFTSIRLQCSIGLQCSGCREQALFSNVFLLNLNFESASHLHCIKYFTASNFVHLADGCIVETENLKKVLDTISKINKKKEGQYEEKIIQVCVKDFDLNKEEVLTSLKKAVDDRMLKIVNKNNKNSYRIVQETHLDDDCVIHSQIHETLESTDAV